MNSKQSIIDNPGEWIITRRGEFIRIKDSEKLIDKNLENIRQHLKTPYQGKVRFWGKSSAQVEKERYDKVLEEVNFDYEKLHDWLYDEKNKNKVEIVKLAGEDFQEAKNSLFNHVKNSKQKWRDKERGRKPLLVNEETGQVIYIFNDIFEDLWDIAYDGPYDAENERILIEPCGRVGSGRQEAHTATLIFFHGTGGSLGNFNANDLAKSFPGLVVFFPHSPILKYDMWHHSTPCPGGGKARGWTNVAGDVWELMEDDVCPNNNVKKELSEIDKVVNIDYPQLMRSAAYINEIVEQEIAKGISPEKIFIAGYSQGGLLALASALTSKHKLGGFISLCGILPCHDKLLKLTKDENKTTPLLIINNSGDSWVPFWTGQKTAEIFTDRGYNVKFKNHPGLGNSWKNEDLVEFLGEVMNLPVNNQPPQLGKKFPYKLFFAFMILGVIVFLTFAFYKIKLSKKKHRGVE